MRRPPNCEEMSGQSPNTTAHLPSIPEDLFSPNSKRTVMDSIAREAAARQLNSGKGKFQLTALVHPGDAVHERRIVVPGRAGWALNELVKAGESGCSAADFPAGLRLAHFVYLLRHEYELVIETEHEAHGGQFPGSHAVYRLKSPVRILDDARQAAA
ncbi:hypothetical protein IG197_01920 [Aminobacter sp. SR38]|uniref:winged helix domain-containing protein n=1 Tax=Aminobacter sp. SR38 TaxID=2774562 RepID=UPI00178351AC|nr:hypothetical protein [Aminobacter sp. SR38]QOF71875.1 hypothetical protein IG197_01920 [Aminobacter sp. SR38]